MRTLSLVTIVAFALLMCPGELTAGEDSWCVVTVAGDTLCECPLDTLYRTSIVSRHSGVRVLVPLDSVVTFFRKGESHAWTGIGIGAMAGAAIGAFVGSLALKPQGLGDVPAVPVGFLGGLLGGLIGSAIGASSGGGTEISLARMTVERKVQVVRYLHSGRIDLAKELSRRKSYR